LLFLKHRFENHRNVAVDCHIDQNTRNKCMGQFYNIPVFCLLGKIRTPMAIVGGGIKIYLSTEI